MDADIPLVIEPVGGGLHFAAAVIADDFGDVSHEALEGLKGIDLAGVGRQQLSDDLRQFFGANLFAHGSLQ